MLASDNEPSEQSAAAVRLYWIPLSAGLDVVRLNVARLSGKVFEAVSALAQQRPPCDLYHAALEVSVPSRRFVIEMTGARDRHGCERGVVCQGAMFAPWLGRFRLFRYEVRCWPGGTIPDAKVRSGQPRAAEHRHRQGPSAAGSGGRDPGAGVGPRPAPHRGNVELELGGLVAAGTLWYRNRACQTAQERQSTGLGSRRGCRLANRPGARKAPLTCTVHPWFIADIPGE
jgi:hypothetical protein